LSETAHAAARPLQAAPGAAEEPPSVTTSSTTLRRVVVDVAPKEGRRQFDTLRLMCLKVVGSAYPSQ
jgi:hypothetical protein